MSNLTFNELKHEYKLDGVTIPSVTQVLEATGLSNMANIPTEILERNARFGKAVHKTIELHIKGTLDYESLDPALVSYLEGWRNFVSDFGFRSLQTEFKSHHPTYRYGLTVDHIGEITKGKHLGFAIGDTKSGCPFPSHKYQLAAYKMAIDKKFNTFILYLDPSYQPSGYKVIFATNNQREQAVFLSALTIFNVRKEEGLL